MASFGKSSPKQFDEAFEELYKQSLTMTPKSAKAIYAVRNGSVGQSPGHNDSIVGIKAIFNRMKERNSSMSELNSSILTSNTSFGCYGEDARNPKGKENQHLEKDDDSDKMSEVYDFPIKPKMPPTTSSSAFRIPQNFPRPVAVPDSFTKDHEFENRYCHRQLDRCRTVQGKKIVKNVCPEVGLYRCPEKGFENKGGVEISEDGITVKSAWNSGSVRNKTNKISQPEMYKEIFPSLGHVKGTAMRGDTEHILQDKRQEHILQDKRHIMEKVTGKVTSQPERDFMRNGQVANSNVKENNSAEKCSYNSDKIVECPSLYVSPSTFSSSDASMTPNTAADSSGENHGDPETLHLVNTLVQRLQSSPDIDPDDNDEWDVGVSDKASTLNPLSRPSQDKDENSDVDSSSMNSDRNEPATETFTANGTVGNVFSTVGDTVKTINGGKVSLKHSDQENENALHCGENEIVDADENEMSRAKKAALTKSNSTKKAAPIKSNSRAKKAAPIKSSSKAEKTAPIKSNWTKKAAPIKSNSTKKAAPIKSNSTKKAAPIKSNSRTKKAAPVKSSSRRRKSAPSIGSCQTEMSEADIIDRDVIYWRRPHHGSKGKDPFSLVDTASEDSEVQVEEDSIFCAGKKLANTSPVIRKRKKSAESTRSKSRSTKIAAEEGEKEILHVSCWSLVPVSRLKSVRIEGKLPNTDYFWLSSVIVERVSACKVKSTNGSLYKLVGNMSSRNSRAAGFSEEFIQMFRHGFPPDWKKLVDSAVPPAELNAKCMKKTLSAQHNTSDSQQMPTNRKSVEGKKCTPLRKKESPLSYHTPDQQKNDGNDSIWTPTGLMSRELGATEVRRTQSGRRIFPPLARWAGQYLRQDDSGNVTIGFSSLAAEKHFAKIAEHEMHAVKRQNKTTTPYRHSSSMPRSRVRLTHQFSLSRSESTGAKRKGKSISLDHVEENFNKADESLKGIQTNVLQSNVSVDHVAEEVEDLVRMSKEKRQQKTRQEKVMCYSGSSGKGKKKTRITSSQSCEHYDEEMISEEEESLFNTTTNKKSRRKRAHSSEKTNNSVRIQGKGRKQQTKVLRAAEEESKVEMQQKGASCGHSGDSDRDSDFDIKTFNHPKTRTRGQRACTDQSGYCSRQKNRSTKGTTDSDARRGKKKVNSELVKTDLELLEKHNCKILPDIVLSTVSEEMLKTETHGALKKRQGKQSTSTSRTRRRNSKKTVTETNDAPQSAESEESQPWSEDEMKNLQHGIEQVSSDHPQYWQAVSQYVGTRSSQECAAFSLRDKRAEPTKKKSKERQAKAKAGTPVLQAKRGTLKRRLQLRAFLEHDNNGSQDDLFQATPFRAKKKAKIAGMDFEKPDEEVFGRNPNFFTPKSDGSHMIGPAFSQTPASSRKTPSLNNHVSPWHNKDSAQKRDVDIYIHRLKNTKRPFSKKKTNATGPSAACPVEKSAAPEGLFQIREEKSYDEEEDEDYYYSEEEEN